MLMPEKGGIAGTRSVTGVAAASYICWAMRRMSEAGSSRMSCRHLHGPIVKEAALGE